MPVSSQDILKSPRADRVLDVIICGVITNLWIPKPKSITIKKQTKFNNFIKKIKKRYLHRIRVAVVKTGWFQSDSVNGTTDVFGSVSQYQTAVDVTREITTNRTTKNFVKNQFLEINKNFI